VSGEEAGGVALGLFAAAIGAGGIWAAIRQRRRRAEIAATYGSTGGILYTAVQAGCSGVLMLGGLGLVVLAIILRH
jgi:hypothetical protein